MPAKLGPHPMVERYTRGDAEIEAQFAAVEPVGRMGTPEEVAEAVVWLCSRRLHSSRATPWLSMGASSPTRSSAEQSNELHPHRDTDRIPSATARR